MLSYFVRGFGFACRESAFHLDKFGCLMIGSTTYSEKVTTLKRVIPFHGKHPYVDTTCFVAPNANVIGNVQFGSRVGVFYQTVIRSDVRSVTVGANTTIQDRCVVRCAPTHETTIGSHVTVEPNVSITGASIADDVFIGSGSTIMPGSRVEAQSIIAPGSVVQKFAVVPSGELWAGVPAEKVRNLTEDEIASLRTSALHSAGLSEAHKEATEKSYEDLHEEEEVLKQWGVLESQRNPVRAPSSQYDAGPSGSTSTLNIPGQLMTGTGHRVM
eukprot:Rhum_TRINITY_DN11193_c0_g10::Rhum_TRINITY_DN11193_c0_g10_i1::g.43146::m.43146